MMKKYNIIIHLIENIEPKKNKLQWPNNIAHSLLKVNNINNKEVKINKEVFNS